MVLYSGTTTYTHTHRHTQTHILSYRNENKQTAAAPNSMDKSYKDVKWKRKVYSVWFYLHEVKKPKLNHDDKSQNRGDLRERGADWE